MAGWGQEVVEDTEEKALGQLLDARRQADRMGPGGGGARGGEGARSAPRLSASGSETGVI